MVGLVQEGFVWGWGELSKVPWKGVEQKRGQATQKFKKVGGGQAGSRGGCLKKGGGAGTPLWTMLLILQEYSCRDLKPEAFFVSRCKLIFMVVAFADRLFS